MLYILSGNGIRVQEITSAEWLSETTSYKWVNSGADTMETIWLAEGRSFGLWDQHTAIKSSK